MTVLQVARDAFAKAIEEGKREIAADPTALGPQVKVARNGYSQSMLALEENTLENAKKLGYLDARELYPDIPPYSLAEFAREFYSLPDPGSEFHTYEPKD